MIDVEKSLLATVAGKILDAVGGSHTMCLPSSPGHDVDRQLPRRCTGRADHANAERLDVAPIA